MALKNIPSKKTKSGMVSTANKSAEKQSMSTGPMEVIFIKPKMSGIMKAIKSGVDVIKNK